VSERAAASAAGSETERRVPDYMLPMPIAFVFGCARSGTSILGELIAAHPEVSYLYEAHHIWRRAGHARDDSHRLVASDAEPEVVRKLRKRFRTEIGGAALLVEKNPRSSLRIPFIRAAFPEAKLVHIYRDGRDVACSLLAGVGGEDWRHLKPPDWARLFADQEGIVRCAAAWRSVMEIILADLADTPHFSIRYEDLVERPNEIARGLFDYLSLPLHPDVVAFVDRIVNTTAGSYQPARQRKWYRDDHDVRVGRWRHNLTSGEAAQVEEMLAPLLKRLGYT
jgi:hypothetical protein